MDVERYRAVLGRCFPGLGVYSLAFLGCGSFRVFEVNGALIFRFPHGGSGAELLRREVRATALLAPRLGVAIPRYDYFSEGCDLFARPVAGYARLPGRPLEEAPRRLARPRRIAAQLGAFLSDLHATPAALAAEAGVPAATTAGMRAWHEQFYEQVRREGFAGLEAAERAWTEALFEPFLADPANWRYTPVLIHGDLDSSNVLSDEPGSAVTGVIDFEELSLGDPAADFCGIEADWGPEVGAAMRAAYRRPVDGRFGPRVAFYARRVLFHELLYGIRENATPFLEHARERLGRAMAGITPIGGWLAASTAELRREPGYPD